MISLVEEKLYRVDSAIKSFEKNPAMKNMAFIESKADTRVYPISGCWVLVYKFPRVCLWNFIENPRPAQMNNVALKRAWVIR